MKEESTQPVIGEFKTKEKFVEFIGVKGNINFISNEATIDGKYLSGLELDGIIFKLTICDENTVNFEEVNTSKTTVEQRQRLLDIISEKTISPIRKRMVVSELPFISVQKIKDKNIDLYLSVDYQRPIDKLASIFFDDEDTSQDNLQNMNINKEQVSKIDTLFSLFEDDDTTTDVEVEKIEEVEVVATEPIYDYNRQIQESFAKVKQEKIDELESRLSNKNKELKRFTQDLNLSTKKVEECKDEIELLQDRLDDLKPQADFNGYYFNVSEMLNEKVILEPEVEEIIKSKVSKIKSINLEAFMKLFEQGEYKIKLGVSQEDNIVEVEDYNKLPESILKSLSEINLQLVDNELSFVGELTWGEIVNKMVKLGFGQDSNFDKNCGSNSYKTNNNEII
jgi:hypothetical protein